jgi:transposase InsO family protein
MSRIRLARPDEDRPIKGALRELAGAWPTYGYRRLTVMLQREGFPVNAKRVRRLMHELGICGEAPRRRPRTTDSSHSYPRFPNLVEGLEVSHPEQVWVADIPYIRLRKELFISNNLCVHSIYPGLASQPGPGSGVDARSLGEGVGAWEPGDPPF